MFEKKSDQSDVSDQIKQMRRNLEDLSAEVRLLRGQLSVLAQGAAEHVADCAGALNLADLDNRYALLTAGITARVTTLEQAQPRLWDKLIAHDKTFRALGADMIARASGDGSVAPVVPAPQPE